MYRLNSVLYRLVPPKKAQAVRSFASYFNGKLTLYRLYRLKSKTFIYRKTRVKCILPCVSYRKVAVQAVQHIVLLDIPTLKLYRLVQKWRYTSGTSGTTSGTDVTTHAA